MDSIEMLSKYLVLAFVHDCEQIPIDWLVDMKMIQLLLLMLVLLVMVTMNHHDLHIWRKMLQQPKDY